MRTYPNTRSHLVQKWKGFTKQIPTMPLIATNTHTNIHLPPPLEVSWVALSLSLSLSLRVGTWLG